MKKDTIETKVDELVDYVYTKGEVTSTTAADALGLSLEQIEEWAKPLEESDMIRIKYSPLHGMVLVSKPLSEKELVNKLNEFKIRKEELKKEQQRLEGAFLKYAEQLPELDYDMKEMERRYREKMGEAKTMTKKEFVPLFNDMKLFHEKLESYEKELSGLQNDKKELGRSVDEFKKDVLTIDKKASLVAKSKALGTFYDYLAKADKDQIETKKKEEKFIAQVTALRRRVDELLPQVELTHKRSAGFNLSKLLRLFRFIRKE